MASAADATDSGRLNWRGFAPALVRAVREHRWAAACCGLLLAVDGLWCRAIDMRITGLALMLWTVTVFTLAGLVWQTAGGMLATHARLGRAGRLLERLGNGTTLFGLWGLTAGMMAVFSYLCAHLAAPLQDEFVAGLDHALGFDWPRWNAVIVAMPTLDRLLYLAYHSHALQFVCLFFVTAFLPDRRRTAELYWTTTVSGVVACAISGLVPVLGGRPHFGFPGAQWVHDLTLVRLPGPSSFDLAALDGIVQFPSYHAALAVLFVWSLRGTGLLLAASLVLNCAMLVATLTDGGHFLTDVIGGLVLALATIVLVQRRLYPRRVTPAGAVPAARPAARQRPCRRRGHRRPPAPLP